MQDQLSFQYLTTLIQNVKGKIDISSTSIQDTITNTNQYTTNPLLLAKTNRYATHTNVSPCLCSFPPSGMSNNTYGLQLIHHDSGLFFFFFQVMVLFCNFSPFVSCSNSVHHNLLCLARDTQ